MHKKPNVIVVFIDDMGYKDLSCMGSDFYETPNIDSIGECGMTFSNGYAACPVCSPSRGSLLTGKYPARLGLTDWIDPTGEFHPLKGVLIDAPYIKHLPSDEKTLAHYLKESGYNCWHVGKWHLGDREHYPDRVGFDVNIGGAYNGQPPQGYFSPWGIETLVDGEEGDFLSDRLTDEAIKLIKNNDGKPYFLNLWHYAVHTPIQAKKEDVEYFTEKAKKMGLDRLNPFVEGEEMPTDDKKGVRVQRRSIQSDPCYAALIYNLDQNVGRLLNAVEESGEKDNTIIIFSSDNGGLATAEGAPTCNLPLSEGKGWTKEGGLRVPLLINFPKLVQKGSICDLAVTTPDIFSTVLELVGTPVKDENIDGVSFLPSLKREDQPSRPIFWHYPHYGNQGGRPGAAVRYRNHKLIQYFEDGRCELYDLANDRSERDNLIYKQPQKTQELLGYLTEWQNKVGALYPIKRETI